MIENANWITELVFEGAISVLELPGINPCHCLKYTPEEVNSPGGMDG
jgi:hypothetical protein